MNNDHIDYLGAACIAQRRIDAQIAHACVLAGQAERTEEMINSSWTLEQIRAELLRPPAAALAPQGGSFEGIVKQAFARMTPAAAGHMAGAPAPAPSRGLGGHGFISAEWPLGRGR